MSADEVVEAKQIHKNNIAKLRQAAMCLGSIQHGTSATLPTTPGFHRQESKPQSVLSIASEALEEVIVHLDIETKVPSPATSQKNTPPAVHKEESREKERARTVKHLFGNMTVVDKGKVNEIQDDVARAIRTSLRYRDKMLAAKVELSKYKQEMVRHVETAVSERMKEKFVQLWSEASNFHNSSFVESRNVMSDHAAFMKKDHEQMVLSVTESLKEYERYMNEQADKVRSAVKHATNEMDRRRGDAEGENKELSARMAELQREHFVKCQSEESLKSELELKEKTIHALNMDVAGAIESAKSFQEKMDVTRRQVMVDFENELRGGFLFKKHCKGKKKVHVKRFTVETSADGENRMTWNDGKKSFSLTALSCGIDGDNRRCFTMTNASRDTLKLESESEAACSLFVSKISNAFMGR
ncbi:hypothetical protein TrRE_jg9611 [Triparma retinervis]|jgi:hypothetical protein|uniref:Uncharacterized protein n=1 Tax=Triparma retinervis TaxID=2557542 RepID=A0A9W7E218_9STRA|nr:hypothetical protein TrRE_jg9611 [Triparma retinervis]